MASPLTWTPWSGVPPELKLAVFRHLPRPDLVNVALTNRHNRALCVPCIYRAVQLRSVEDTQLFLASVPPSRMQLIRQLVVATRPTTISEHDGDALLGPWDLPQDHETRGSEVIHEFLAQCSQLEALDLRLYGTLLPSVLPAFRNLPRLYTLRISNRASEEHLPIGERLVVAMASAAPNLVHLSISGISRSLMHAPELLGTYPLVPISDDCMDVFPSSPISAKLCLPELLALPNLRSLSIQDTHLGDAKWKDAQVSSSLTKLVIGTPCAFALPETVKEYTDDLLANPALGARKTYRYLSASTILSPPPTTVSSQYEHMPSTGSTPSMRSSRFSALTPLVIGPPTTSFGYTSDTTTPTLCSASSSSSTSSLGPNSPEFSPTLEVHVGCFADCEFADSMASAQNRGKTSAALIAAISIHVI